MCTRDVSSSSFLSVSPCWYVDAVIFLSSKGWIPAFLKPAFTLCSVVAVSHGSIVYDPWVRDTVCSERRRDMAFEWAKHGNV